MKLVIKVPDNFRLLDIGVYNEEGLLETGRMFSREEILNPHKGDQSTPWLLDAESCGLDKPFKYSVDEDFPASSIDPTLD